MKPMTAIELASRKKCCGHGCVYCPYTPMWVAGSYILRDKELAKLLQETKNKEKYELRKSNYQNHAIA